MDKNNKDKIKKLESELRREYNYWHDKMAYPYSDDFSKMRVARKEYLELKKKIRKLKGKA